MKKTLFLTTLLVILALSLALIVGCANGENPGGSGGNGDGTGGGLPAYDTTANATIYNEYTETAARYKVFEGRADSVYDENDNLVTITYKDGDTYVGASSIVRSGVKNFKVFSGKKLTYVKVVSVTYIDTDEDFNNINNNLDGYYVLRSDIYFNGICTVIGKAPLVRDDSTMYTYDKTGNGSTLAQLGVPFTGTFDGNGHTIYDYSISYSPTATSRAAYCMGLFEYVGEGAFVGNFNLKRANVTVGHYGAILAGVNLGAISNVMIHKDCALTVDYAECAGIAVYNGGTIEDVECYVTTADSSTGLHNLSAIYEDDGATANCYVGAPYAVQYVVENDDVQLIEGIQLNLADIVVSVVYSDGGEGFAEIIRADGYDPDGVLNVAQTVKLYYGESDSDYVTMKVTPIAKSVSGLELVDNDFTTEYVVNTAQLNLTNLILTVYYNNGTSANVQVTNTMIDNESYTLSQVGSYTVAISYGGYTCSYVITVIGADVVLQGLRIEGEPTKSAYPFGGSVALDDLQGITLLAEYSDDSSLEVGLRLSMLSYDFRQVGATQIVVEYGEMIATIDVTVYDYAVELYATLKGDGNVVSYSAAELPNFNDICQFEVVWASGKHEFVTDVTATNYKAGLSNGVKFIFDDVEITSDIQFEIWFVITNGSEWASINDNLAGYYRLGCDITLNALTSAVIGQAPLNLISADDGYEINIEGKNRAGIPFTGKFDGDGHTIYNFTTKYSGNAYDIGSYALTPFGYIGAGAKVYNFTLAGANITCGQAGSFIAALNMGEISDVIIAADCSLYVYYGSSVPAVAVVNGGKISNVTCYATEYSAYKNFGENAGQGYITIVAQKTLAGGTEENCWLAARDDTDSDE